MRSFGKPLSRGAWLLMFALAALLTGCAASQLNNMWREPTYDAPDMRNVLVVALRRAQEMMGVLGRLDVIHEGRLLPRLTTSIGVAVFPEDGIDAAALSRHADAAMYRAKDAGRPAAPGR